MKTGAAFFSVFALFPILAGAQEMAPVALNSLSATPHAIVGAPVMDQHDRLLGKVVQVQTGVYGHPAALAFMPVHGKGVVVVGAAAVSYDGTTVVADDTQPQIAALSDARLASK